MSDICKNTPLIDFHKRHGARIVDFAGWNMPVQYAGIIEEHKAVRNDVGLFDASHMGESLVSGVRALEFLNSAFSNDFTSLEIGHARYAVFCNVDGTCVDDVIVYRLSQTSYMVVLNASNAEKDLRLLSEFSRKFGGNVEVEDISAGIALLAVQGPKSPEAMQKAFGFDFTKVPRFGFEKRAETIFSRTGYTGSDGFEIFCPSDEAELNAEKILALGGAELCGLGSRDSLRVEACYPLYGHEIGGDITPLEAGLGWAVKLEKNFIGRDALAKQKSEGLARKVVWFSAQGRRIARAGDSVFSGGKSVGKVLSGVWSGSAQKPLGSAIVDANYLNEPLYTEVRGSKIEIELRGKSK